MLAEAAKEKKPEENLLQEEMYFQRKYFNFLITIILVILICQLKLLFCSFLL